MRHEKLASTVRPWSPEDEEELFSLAEAGTAWASIGEQLQRSQPSVQTRYFLIRARKRSYEAATIAAAFWHMPLESS